MPCPGRRTVNPSFLARSFRISQQFPSFPLGIPRTLQQFLVGVSRFAHGRRFHTALFCVCLCFVLCALCFVLWTVPSYFTVSTREKFYSAVRQEFDILCVSAPMIPPGAHVYALPFAWQAVFSAPLRVPRLLATHAVSENMW